MIALVRHGETAANREGRLQGRLDLPLNETGRVQADGLAAALARGTRPLVVVTSPLLRARQTAAVISAATGAPLEVDDRLIEVDYGDLDGRPLAEVPADLARRWRTEDGFAPPNGESLAAVSARVEPCLDVLLDRGDEGLVVAVSHVTPIKAAVTWALGIHHLHAWRMFLDTASITRIGRGVDGPVLRGLNERVIPVVE